MGGTRPGKEVNYKQTSLRSTHELVKLVDEVRSNLPLITCLALLMALRHDRSSVQKMLLASSPPRENAGIHYPSIEIFKKYNVESTKPGVRSWKINSLQHRF